MNSNKFVTHIKMSLYSITCTMMKPHFKGKTTSTNPMYVHILESSYTLGCMTIHPSCIVKHGACGGETLPMSGLWHHSTSTSQLY